MSSLNPPTSKLPGAAGAAGVADPNAIRVVLFGMPDAGKSSLLGALAQAAHVQARQLRGHLTDVGSGLSELRRRVYDDHQSSTQNEIIPYPVRFLPNGKGGTAESYVLYDCDGRVANDYLTGVKPIDARKKAGQLAQAVLSADALMMAVDASASPDQVDRDLREFLKFLKGLQKRRGQDYSVGGFPVYLVINKCDRLAGSNVSHSLWQSAIEDKRQSLAARFREFLDADDDQLSFGSLDFRVLPTSAFQPSLIDVEAKPREPFGVAELFHEAFEKANGFRHRATRSSQKLATTALGAGGFLATLAAVAGFLLLNPAEPPATNTLSTKIDLIQSTEGQSAASRLAASSLERRLKELTAIQSDPGFMNLPEDQKSYIGLRIEEAQAYLKFRDELLAVPAPSKARSLAELKQAETRLQKIAPPSSYRSEWTATEAVLLHERTLTKDIPALRDSVGRLTAYFHSANNKAASLLLKTDDLSPEWEQRVVQLSDETEKSRPFSKSDPQFGTAYRFDDVVLAENDWQSSKNKLGQLREIARAIGLTGDATGPKAPLAVVETPANTSFVEAVGKRWAALKASYPESGKWSTSDLPDTVRPEIVKRLRQSLQNHVRDSHKMIVDRLAGLNPTGVETAADWSRVAEYLLSPSMQSWREFTTYLFKLYNPANDDVVQDLVGFLRRSSFDLQPLKVTLKIPDTLSDAPVKPVGEWTITIRRPDGETSKLTLRAEPQTRRDEQSVVYTYTLFGNGKAVYKPGEILTAELNVKRGDRDAKLSWIGSRTSSYQFERLLREPRLHDVSLPAADGVSADGLLVQVVEGSWPIVPTLLPSVRLK